MKGSIVLEGGAEFGGQMAAVDRRALELAGGAEANVVILPTAAAPDHNHQRAGGNGLRWFQSLGARQVTLLALIDRATAEDAAIAAAIRRARLIYLLGGFTHYLGQTLAGSLCLQAMREAHSAGAVVAGSSAGAMVLCQDYFNPETSSVVSGLGFVPNACVIPHHDTFGKGWAPRLTAQLPGGVLIGIDEQTGMIDDGPEGAWTIYGKGAVTLYRNGRATVFHSGEAFQLSLF